VRGTLAWQHPVEKALWEEDYRVAGGWLRELVLARSGFTPDYRLCFDGRRRPLSHEVPLDAGTTSLRPCP
jgi:hypothetical protein